MPGDNVEVKVKPSFPRTHKFARAIKKGKSHAIRFQAFRSSATFRRLKRSLKTLPRNPKVIRKSVVRQSTWDRFAILQQPCTSERFYKKMETENIIIFYVSPKANKLEIKNAFKEAFGIVPDKVNTMNTITGRKKAFVKIPKTNEASEVANKIGLI
jgi:ribosomal protein L23